MGLLRRLLTALGGGGGVWFEIWEYPTFTSEVNLCAQDSVFEVCSMSSLVTLSELAIELFSSFTNVAPALCVTDVQNNIAQLTSVVALSQV